MKKEFQKRELISSSFNSKRYYLIGKKKDLRNKNNTR
tara:strand:- start:149 stop:259 length:111 start_codon:yes stop_codon:yes gene_type:complete